MLYQELLLGKKAYFVSVGNASAFEIHRHPEIELSCCIDGEFDIFIDNKEYRIKSGELAFVKPMSAHEGKTDGAGARITIEIGPGFLGEYFDAFVEFDYDVVIDTNKDNEACRKLSSLLLELSHLIRNPSEFSELSVRGILFLITNIIFEHFSKDSKKESHSKSIYEIKKVEHSLRIIHEEYATKLDIDYVCQQCGYSKSHFCRVFKKITGDTFYNVLNRHRIETACMYLRESKTTVDEIATLVGFSDSKTFCRAFKAIMGISPGTYRKSNSVAER